MAELTLKALIEERNRLKERIASVDFEKRKLATIERAIAIYGEGASDEQIANATRQANQQAIVVESAKLLSGEPDRTPICDVCGKEFKSYGGKMCHLGKKHSLELAQAREVGLGGDEDDLTRGDEDE